MCQTHHIDLDYWEYDQSQTWISDDAEHQGNFPLPLYELQSNKAYNEQYYQLV